MISNQQQRLEQPNNDIELSAEQPNEYTDGGDTNELGKVAIGALVATLGTLRALAMKNTY